MSDSNEAPTWSLDHRVLRIVEHGKVTASDELIALVDPAAWSTLGIGVSRRPDDPHWTISASQFAGVARIQTTTQTPPIQVEIAPKIADLDLFFLADWAYSATGAAHRSTSAHLDALRSDPAACILGWYLQALIDFATRWLRRGYVWREEDLIGRVRGRVLVERYTRSLAVARAHVIPCRYAEPTQDTTLNQFLKAGLRRALALVPSLPVPSARLHLRQLGSRAIALFSGVADVQHSAQHANRLPITGPHRHYRPLVTLTRAILAGSYLSPTAGDHLQHAFIYNINTLFQEALRNILASWPGAALERPRATARLVDRAGAVLRRQGVYPDYAVALPGQQQRVLLDAKYTSINVSADTDDLSFAAAGERIRVRRSEIYQAVSYTHHDRWSPAQAVLVYPISLPPSGTLPPPLQVQGFGSPVHLMFLDVGPHAHANVDHFYRELDQTLGHASPTSHSATAS